MEIWHVPCFPFGYEIESLALKIPTPRIFRIRFSRDPGVFEKCGHSGFPSGQPAFESRGPFESRRRWRGQRREAPWSFEHDERYELRSDAGSLSVRFAVDAPLGLCRRAES